MSTPPSPASVRATLDHHIPALDGIRGIAILAVLMHQLIIDLPASAGAASNRWIAILLSPLAAGWTGVQLFFVLSGFLITGILLDSKQAENYWSSFFARRALRIFPPYYLLLALTFLVVPALDPSSPEVASEHRLAGWYWLYLTNWRFLATSGHVTSLAHCWSLAIEEQFYLVWPFVVRKLGPRGLLRLCVGIACAAPALRIVLLSAGVDPEIIYEGTLTRADAIALGAIAAVLVRDPLVMAAAAPRLRRWLAVAIAALAATALASGGLARHNPVSVVVGESVVAAAAALLIVQATLVTAAGDRGDRLARGLSLPLLRRFGRYSYAIYLFHRPLHLAAVSLYFDPRLAGAGPARLLAYQGAYLVGGPLVLLGLGAAFYRVFERPILSLKRHFPTRSAAPAP